jgi:steroid delta-isomerase-like uncharacterized protein
MPRTKSEKAVKIPEAEQLQTPESVARAIFEGLAVKDMGVIDRFVHPEAVDDFVAIGEFHGRESIRQFFAELFTAFPEFEMDVERIVASDTAAVVQWRASGTFTGGPFLGIEPTGRRVEIRGVDVMEIEGGQVRHNTIYYDGNAFARQVGLMPKRDSGMDRAIVSAFNSVTKLRTRLRNRDSG